jgi:hypothetical protein
MHSFYKLACALVAWSALSLTAQAATQDALSGLPRDAFQRSTEHPDRFIYRTPGTDLHAYHGVLIEPLAFFGKDQGDWKILVAAEDNPVEQHYRAKLTDVLLQHGVAIAEAPGPGIVRLRSALMTSDGTAPEVLQPCRAEFNLAHRVNGVNAYLHAITAIAQVEDALNGGLLAGSVDFSNTPFHAPKGSMTQTDLLRLIDHLAEDSGARLARILST